ncbi:protein WVD2-like 7 [Selaginella moellendorffii]|uniref:protein WVD2-like 7 n=1 Tax=Selaginella moellendorffii TaxID=88036 RepID=UPI000D1CF1B6|nr:protein WVD2-like 7 [Selaginella moellendorffii]|eukprot:XP_024538829.1 protein WVD2-like 7 [Selaginella moellendorffii]
MPGRTMKPPEEYIKQGSRLSIILTWTGSIGNHEGQCPRFGLPIALRLGRPTIFPKWRSGRRNLWKLRARHGTRKSRRLLTAPSTDFGNLGEFEARLARGSRGGGNWAPGRFILADFVLLCPRSIGRARGILRRNSWRIYEFFWKHSFSLSLSLFPRCEERLSMDGSTMVGPRQRSCVFLPSRYIEELDGASSPGLVSKKAAFFEEAIQSASSERCSVSSRRSRRASSACKIGDDDVIDQSDATVRTLDFSSGCEESKDSSCEEHSDTVLEEIKLDGTSLVDGDNIGKVGSTTTISSGVGSALKENKDPDDDGRQSQEAPAVQQTKNNAKPSMRKGNKTHKEMVHPIRVCGHLTQRACANKRRGSIPSDVVADLKNPSRRVNAVRKSTGFQSLALPADKKKTTEGTDSRPRLERQIPTSTKAQVGTTGSTKQDAKEYRLAEKSLEEKKESKKSSPNAGLRRSQEFQLKSGERAIKRKEFYAKLAERLAAKEQEKNQIKAKSQEEKEADLRKLRRSLTFKAKPMPDFYHEQPAETKASKKVPATRAISPRLGRLERKTSVDTHHEHHHVRLCQQQRHHSANPSLAPASKKKTPSAGKSRSGTANASSSTSSPSLLSTNQTAVQSSCGSSSSVEIRQEDGTTLLASSV